MASEIRVNRLSNRSGLSTITFANGGVQFSGITTFANGDFRVGTGATILNPSTNEMQFHTGGSNRLTIDNSGINLGVGSITVGDATFTGSVSIGKTLTYEDVKNVDSIGIVTARTGVKVTGGDFTVGTAITASSVTGNVTQDVGITTFSGSATWFKGTTANKDAYWSKSSGSLIFKDNAAALFGNSSDLQIKHDGSDSIIHQDGTGDLRLRSDNSLEFNTNGTANAIWCDSGAAVKLYYNNSLKFLTTNTGVKIDNSSTTDMLLLDVGGTNFAKIGHNSSGGVAVLDVRSEGHIRFLTGGNNERLRITSSGNMGLGDLSNVSNTPQTLLHIANTSPTFRIQDTTNDFYAHISSDDGGNLILDADAGNGAGSSYMLFKTDGSEKLRIESNGRIAIGNFSGASNDVHLKKANAGGDVALRITNNTNQNSGSTASLYFTTSPSQDFNTSYIRAVRDGGKLRFGYATNEPVVTMRVSTGMVGIGTDNPTSPLSFNAKRSTQTVPPICFQTSYGAGLADSAISTTDDTGGTDIMMGSNVYMGQNGAFVRYYSSYGSAAVRCQYTGNTLFYNKSGNNAPVESMRIDGSGRLKIGTISDHTQAVTQCPVYIRMNTDITAVNTAEGAANTGLLRIEETGSNANRYFGIELRNRQSGDIRLLNKDVNTSDRGDLVLVMPSSAAPSLQGCHQKLRFNSIEDAIQIAGKGGAVLAGSNVEKTDIYISTVTGVTAVNTQAGDAVAGLIRFEDKGSSNNRYHGLELRNRNSGDARILNKDEGVANKSSLVFATDNGSDIYERLRIHSDGRILTPPVSGRGGIGLVGAFMARPSSTYSVNAGTNKVNCATEEFDANGWYDTSNSQYKPLCKGWYQLNFFFQIRTNINSQSVEMQLYPYFNGSSTAGPVHGWSTNYGNYAHITYSTMMYFDGVDDYVEMFGNSSRSTEVSTSSRFSGFLVHPLS